MYAIVRTGGKQYRVEEGRTLSVELLPAKEGSSVELKDVLLIADDGEVTVGTPTIDGARVLADVEAHDRAKKIIVFKYRAKVRTRKKTGHRQHLTRLAVTEILRAGQESKVAKPKRRRAKAASAEADADASASAATPTEEAAVAKDKPAPKRRTRKAAPATAKAASAAKTDDKPAAKRTRRTPVKAKTASAAGTGKKAAPKRRTRKAATPKASTETETKDEQASAKPARKRTSRAKASSKTDGDKE